MNKIKEFLLNKKVFYFIAVAGLLVHLWMALGDFPADMIKSHGWSFVVVFAYAIYYGYNTKGG